MKKNVVSALGSFIIVVLFCWTIGVNIWTSMAVVAASIVFFWLIGDILFEEWKKWSTLPWYYWVMVGLMFAGALIDLMATTWGSPKWTLVGLIMIAVGAVIWGIMRGVLKKS